MNATRDITAGLVLLAVALICLAPAGIAAETGPETVISPPVTGAVTLPLDEYQQLLNQAATLPLPAPSGYAVGLSNLEMTFRQRDGRVTATIQADIGVSVFEDEWTLVALLGPGGAWPGVIFQDGRRTP